MRHQRIVHARNNRFAPQGLVRRVKRNQLAAIFTEHVNKRNFRRRVFRNRKFVGIVQAHVAFQEIKQHIRTGVQRTLANNLVNIDFKTGLVLVNQYAAIIEAHLEFRHLGEVSAIQIEDGRCIGRIDLGLGTRIATDGRGIHL